MSYNKVDPLASQNTGGRDGEGILGPSFIPMLIIEDDSVKWLHYHGNSLLKLHELLGNELLGSLLGGEKLGSHGSHLRSAVLQEHLFQPAVLVGHVDAVLLVPHRFSLPRQRAAVARALVLHLRPHGILHLALFVSVGLARGIFGQVNIRVIKATGVVISKAGSFDPLEAEVPSFLGLSLADEAGVKFLHNNFWYFHHLLPPGVPHSHHLLKDVCHLGGLDLRHQALHDIVADCDVDSVLLEAHLSNLSTSVLFTLCEGAFVLEPLPKLILSAIILPNIVPARVDHERQVALGVEARRVVVHRGGHVDRAALQASPLLPRLSLAFADLTNVRLLRKFLYIPTWRRRSVGNISLKY